jgi:hypothetical protein
MSLDPFPPTPTPATRKREFAPIARAGSNVKAKAEAAADPRNNRRE